MQKILNKILANQIQQCMRKHYTPQLSEIYPRYAGLVQHSKIKNQLM